MKKIMIDGVKLEMGDRIFLTGKNFDKITSRETILLKHQLNPKLNGIYAYKGTVK